MTDSAVRPPLRIDLHAAMGDPRGAHAELLPTESDDRIRLAQRDISLADYWYLRGYRAYLERDYRAAVEALNICLLHQPGRAEAHFAKGVSLQLLALREAEENPRFPDEVPPRAQGLLLKARWALSIALELNPGDEEARTYIQGLEALLR